MRKNDAVNNANMEQWPLEAWLLQNFADDEAVKLALNVSRRIPGIGQGNRAYDFGATIGGLVGYSYTKWLVKECLQKDVRQLFFIARDGYLIKLLVDDMVKQRSLPLQTHYLYGSRKAWRLPAYDGSKEEMRRFLIQSFALVSRSLTWAELARQLGLPLSAMMHFLPKDVSGQDKLTILDLRTCLRYLADTEEFRQMVLKVHHEQHELAQAYLAQKIGEHAQDKCAFVELDGSGYTMECMARLIAPIFPAGIDVLACYVRQQASEAENNAHCRFINFLPEATDLLIELFFRATHEQTVAYARKDNMIEPVLWGEEGRLLQQYGYGDYLTGVRRFCQYLGELAKDWPSGLDVSPVFILKILRQCGKDIGRPEMSFLADMPFAVTGAEKRVTAAVPCLSKVDLRCIYLLHRDEPSELYYQGIESKFMLARCDMKQKHRICKYQQQGQRILERYRRLYGRSPVGAGSGDIHFAVRPFWGKKIVIYGAGKFGKIVYRLLSQSDAITVTGWLDRAYEKLSAEGWPVLGDGELLRRLEYDLVLIAALDMKRTIRKSLGVYGVPDDKIISLTD